MPSPTGRTVTFAPRAASRRRRSAAPASRAASSACTAAISRRIDSRPARGSTAAFT
ncbi:hypothetical protein [Geodermatophilus sp. CPCC 205761]|uniref:hypothetical protein n=1 Tax=Geodermatophilus sp. CPCC 205761 TaxID=2936597 RepID=UPI003EEA6EF7